MELHDFLDCNYGPDGDEVLLRMLAGGADPSKRQGPRAETPLHVATRRRRTSAVEILLAHGADIDAKTSGGKTAYAHAVRRGFSDVVQSLLIRGARTDLNQADRLAVAIVNGYLDEARTILAAHPDAARTGNPEEDRLLADVAGRNRTESVALLITAGADLTAPGLDSGTPLHQAAWFGQPDNARLLIDAGRHSMCLMQRIRVHRSAGPYTALGIPVGPQSTRTRMSPWFGCCWKRAHVSTTPTSPAVMLTFGDCLKTRPRKLPKSCDARNPTDAYAQSAPHSNCFSGRSAALRATSELIARQFEAWIFLRFERGWRRM